MGDLWYDRESRLHTDPKYEEGQVVKLSDESSGEITDIHFSKVGVQYQIDGGQWVFETESGTWGAATDTYVIEVS